MVTSAKIVMDVGAENELVLSGSISSRSSFVHFVIMTLEKHESIFHWVKPQDKLDFLDLIRQPIYEKEKF